MRTTGSILIYGHDAILLETRRLLLKGAGFTVQTACVPPDPAPIVQQSEIGLLMLCQTLSPEECTSALVNARAVQPRIKTLILRMNPLDYPLPGDSGCCVVDVLIDPARFIQMVRGILRAPGPAASAIE